MNGALAWDLAMAVLAMNASEPNAPAELGLAFVELECRLASWRAGESPSLSTAIGLTRRPRRRSALSGDPFNRVLLPYLRALHEGKSQRSACESVAESIGIGASKWTTVRNDVRKWLDEFGACFPGKSELLVIPRPWKVGRPKKTAKMVRVHPKNK